jgi:hypothetical protein
MFNVRRFGPALVSLVLVFGLEFASAGVAVAELLPDLTMLQPNEFRLELLSPGVRRLRFSTYIVNLGPGRFDVIGSDPDPVARSLAPPAVPATSERKRGGASAGGLEFVAGDQPTAIRPPVILPSNGGQMTSDPPSRNL